jgi:hypothetical protein
VESFSLEKSIPAGNRRLFWYNKPLRGYWLCEYTPFQRFLRSWHKWCINEGYNLKANNYLYTLKNEPKIYTIRNRDDYLGLTINYPIYYRNHLEELEFLMYIDFEKLGMNGRGYF